MKQKVLEIAGLLINGLSIPLLFYLMFILDAPDFLHPLVYLGWVILGSGIALVVLSIVALVRNQGAGLIESGIYGLVRHPMYLGAMLCFFSYSFFHAHWLIFLISCANIAIVYCFVLQGDQMNVARFGDAYSRYMEAVPRINVFAGVFRRLRAK